MNSFVSSYLSSIDKIEYYSDYKILYCQNKKYYYRELNYSIDEIFDYFKKIHFTFIPSLIDCGNHCLFYLIEDEREDVLLKEKRLIEVLSSLHVQSMEFMNYKQEERKEKYQSIRSLIDSRMKYYLSIQDDIDEYSFPPPASYLLLKNMSKIYQNLHFAEKKLEDWYRREENQYREVFLIGNVEIDNFHFGENSYFYHYGVGNRGELIYDLVSFLEENIIHVDIKELFDLYQENLSLTDSEIDLFFCLLAIPQEIEIHNQLLSDTVFIRRFIDNIDKISFFLLEENKEDQETD